MKKIRKALIIEIYKLLSGVSGKDDISLMIKLPCGTKMTLEIKGKKQLVIVKAG